MSSTGMNMWQQMPKGMKVGALIGLGVIAFFTLALVFGWVVQFLWNATVADMFGWPEISYWQAIGIFVLAKFLFGFGVGGGSNSASGKKKTAHKRAEVAEAPSETGQEDLTGLPDNEDFQRFWATEGKDAWESFKRGV